MMEENGDVAMPSSPFAELRHHVLSGISYDAMGYPIALSPLFDGVLKIRFRAALWIRSDTMVERIHGAAPLDGGGESSKAVQGALSTAAQATQRDRQFAADLAQALDSDPWVVLGQEHGSFVGHGVDDRRSVVTPCAKCDTAGDTACEICGGHGEFTEHHESVARVDYSLSIEIIGNVPDSLRAQFKRAYQGIAAEKLFTPRLVGFTSEGAAHMAVFEAELPAAAAKVEIGRRLPHICDKVFAFGDPLTLVDPPPLLDRLHQRALDSAHIRGGPRKAQLADTLANSRLGRQALASAARRRHPFKPHDLSPFATSRLVERLSNIAKYSHRMVGHYRRRWVWTATAASAPLLGLGLMLSGYGEFIENAATGSLAVADTTVVDPSGIETAAIPSLSVAQSAALAFGGMVPFFLWWVLAIGVVGFLYARTMRRAIGVARPLRFKEVITMSSGPSLALLFGGVLYAIAFYGVPNISDWSGRVAGKLGVNDAVGMDGVNQDDLGSSRIAIVTEDTTTIETGSVNTAVAPVPFVKAPRTAPGDSLARYLDLASGDKWLLLNGAAMVRAETGRSVLQLQCTDRGPAFILHSPDLGSIGRVQMMVDGRMNGGQHTAYKFDHSGEALWWRSSRQARKSMAQAKSARLFVSSSNRSITTAINFALEDFKASARAALRLCSYS